jgi:hypothetical protein
MDVQNAFQRVDSLVPSIRDFGQLEAGMRMDCRRNWRDACGVALEGLCLPLWLRPATRFLAVILLLAAVAIPVAGRDKDKISYGEGLIVNIPMREAEVAQVVEDVAQNGIIRGTKEYNKDEYVSGAKAATSSPVFPAWTEGGKVFYKVREQAIDPRNFKDSGDVGTLVVRYVIQPQGDKNTVLRINALFEESFRKTVHPSNGSVETAEYKDIHDHLEAIEVMREQTIEAEEERKEARAKKLGRAAADQEGPADSQQSSSKPAAGAEESTVVSAVPAPATDISVQSGTQLAPGQSLADHVQELRKQVERLVKAPGAPLKSAPFHTASTLQSLTPGAEVLILITTPYWYGVETHDGQHGWLMRDQLVQP